MRAMVESRCAIAITVLSAISVSRLCWIARFDFAVERRRRLVEHQDRRVLQDDARDRDALALSAGQFHAALADMRVVAAPVAPVFEVGDEAVGMRERRRRGDFRVGRIGAAIGDVLADRAMQQRGILRHHRDAARAAIPASRSAMSWPSIRMRPLPAVEEPQQQVDQRRLARAGAADQADLLARRDRRFSPLMTSVSRP